MWNGEVFVKMPYWNPKYAKVFVKMSKWLADDEYVIKMLWTNFKC